MQNQVKFIIFSQNYKPSFDSSKHKYKSNEPFANNIVQYKLILL